MRQNTLIKDAFSEKSFMQCYLSKIIYFKDILTGKQVKKKKKIHKNEEVLKCLSPFSESFRQSQDDLYQSRAEQHLHHCSREA